MGKFTPSLGYSHVLCLGTSAMRRHPSSSGDWEASAAFARASTLDWLKNRLDDSYTFSAQFCGRVRGKLPNSTRKSNSPPAVMGVPITPSGLRTGTLGLGASYAAANRGRDASLFRKQAMCVFKGSPPRELLCGWAALNSPMVWKLCRKTRRWAAQTKRMGIV